MAFRFWRALIVDGVQSFKYDDIVMSRQTKKPYKICFCCCLQVRSKRKYLIKPANHFTFNMWNRLRASALEARMEISAAVRSTVKTSCFARRIRDHILVYVTLYIVKCLFKLNQESLILEENKPTISNIWKR